MAVIIGIDIPKRCGDCPLCIYTADEKRAIGYCNTSDEDYYCKALDRFMEYDKVEGGVDILGKPNDCPLKSVDGLIHKIDINRRVTLKDTPHDDWSRKWNKCIDEVIAIIKEYCKVK